MAVRLIDGDSFEFNGRLRLVIHLAAAENHRGCSVEQPAETRCERRIDLALDHARQHARFLFASRRPVLSLHLQKTRQR